MAVGLTLATPRGELLALTFMAHVIFFLAIIVGNIKSHFTFVGSVGNAILGLVHARQVLSY